MRNYLTSFIVISSLFAIAACSNGGGGNSAPTPSCPAPYQYDAGTKTCVSGGGVTPLPTPVPTNVAYYDYDRYFVSNGWGVQVYQSDLQIVNPAAYKTFLKEAMGVCDRSIWGGQWGLHDCNSWIGGSFQVTWSMNSSMVPQVNFTAYPQQNAFQYSLSIGIDNGGAAYNPLRLPQHSHQTTTFNYINQSKGFEIRGYGSPFNGGGLRLIQIQVNAGTLADNTVSYELYYPHNNVATMIAKGKFKKY